MMFEVAVPFIVRIRIIAQMLSHASMLSKVFSNVELRAPDSRRSNCPERWPNFVSCWILGPNLEVAI